MDPMQALLTQRVIEENQQREQAASLGGAIGGTIGLAAGAAIGAVPHELGERFVMKGERSPMGRLRPGFRMAGGLTGMLVSGALGSQLGAAVRGSSPSANYLAKLQAGQPLNQVDKEQLQKLLFAEMQQLGTT